MFKHIIYTISVSITTVFIIFLGKNFAERREILKIENNHSLNIIETQYKLNKEVNDWFERKAPNTMLTPSVVIEECINYDIDIILVLSQGLLESHYGTVGLAKKTNQVFNVGAYSGFLFDNIHSSYKFDHPDQSVKPYLKLLTDRYLVDKCEADLFNKFTDKHNKRYASAENYEKNLRLIRDEILGTTKIDSLYQTYKNLIIEHRLK
jgi:hypothetical protein